MVADFQDNKKYNSSQDKNRLYRLEKRIHFASIESTNTWAKDHFEMWSTKGLTLVTASHQTKGRGQLGREWLSPEGMNLYASFCFWFPLDRMDMGNIPQVMMLSVCRLLEEKGLHPKIKWPNDLMLSEKKLAGVLCETIMEEEKRGVICGLGLNINMSDELLSQIDQPATSLKIEIGETVEIESFLESLVMNFAIDLERFVSEGFSNFLPFFLERSFLKAGEAISLKRNIELG